MGYYTIASSILILFFVIIFELFRPKKMIIDYLSGINAVYVLVFAIAPLYIYLFNEYTTWTSIKMSDLTSGAFLYGSFLSLVFYLCTVISYYFFGKFKINTKLMLFSERIFTSTNNVQYSKVGLILLTIGGVSLVAYIGVLGGFSNFLELGPKIRSQGSVIDSPFIFLKNVAPLLTVSAFIYYALIADGKFKISKYLFYFLLSLIGSSLILFHSSGRISFFVFLITFPLAHFVLKNRIKIKTIFMGTLLFFFIVLFGDNLMNVNSEMAFQSNNLSNIGTSIGSVIEEFSFPITNIANTVLVFPEEYKFRYGLLDFIRGLDTVIPRSILSIDLLTEERPSQLNTRIFNSKGTMPVDIVTFGYMSFGFAGVMIIGILFGLFSKIFESLFYYRKNLTSSIFFSSWMIFFAFRIVYGDPGLAYASVFDLAVGTILLYFFSNKRNKSYQLKNTQIIYSK